MKILLIGPFPSPIDGCSNSNRILYQNLKANGTPCDFINTNTTQISGSQGTRFSFRKSFLFLAKYLHSFKVAGADAVYMTPGQTFYGVLKYAPFIVICWLLQKPYTIHVHGNFLGVHYRSLSGLKKKVMHRLISRASAGIVITQSLKRNFEGLLPDAKIFVVEYFVESEIYDAPFTKVDDKLRILYLSNLMREKGILEFLDAMITLKKKNILFTTSIAGSIEVGLEQEVNTRLKELGESVNYLGVVKGNTRVKKLLESNVFILPTYYTMEGLPFSLLEALATGNMVITTAHAGIPDVITDLNGVIVEKRSASAISDILVELSQNIPAMVQKYSVANRAYARTNFTEANFTSKILSVLHGVSKARFI